MMCVKHQTLTISTGRQYSSLVFHYGNRIEYNTKTNVMNVSSMAISTLFLSYTNSYVTTIKYIKPYLL